MCYMYIIVVTHVQAQAIYLICICIAIPSAMGPVAFRLQAYYVLGRSLVTTYATTIY